MTKKSAPDFEKAEARLLSHLSGLSPELTYHGPHHSMDVLEAAMRIADTEKITDYERKLLRISVLLHDAGFVYLYKNHEERGCELAMELLPAFNFDKAEIEMICGMIRATKTPQEPKTKLEEIIADADLDYLGRSDVHDIAATLFTEFKTFGVVRNEEDWNRVQINFLQKHHYFTDYARKNRQPGKQRYLDALVAAGAQSAE